MISPPTTLLNHPRSQVEGTSSNNPTEPSSVHSLTTFKGNKKTNNPYKPSIARMPAAFEGYDLEDSSLSATLIASSRATSHNIGSRRLTRALSTTLATPSLPNHKSYAQHEHSILDYSVQEEPTPTRMSSLGKWTLTPGNIQPCVYPDRQLTLLKLGACQQTPSSRSPLSSTTASIGDEAHRNKTCNINNSASQEMITLLASKKKGKGMSITKELDPEAVSPTNDSPIPASQGS